MPELLRDHTTMRLGGPARRFEVATSTVQLLELVQAADRTGEPVLVLGGGSNLIVADAGFDGLVVQVASSGLDIEGHRIRVDAGLDWDAVVLAAIDAGLAGIESLSGIPGTVGGTPVQNVGAYGTLTSTVLAGLTVLDRASGAVESWGPERCGFGSHRQSVLKASDRFVVLDVSYELVHSGHSTAITYAALAERLDVPVGADAPVKDVRAAVLELRAERGMLLDPDDHDTWSVGSFFVNPVLTAVPDAAADCPRYPDPAGTKLSAAWLIERAGFHRGYRIAQGNVRLSGRHTLALTNLGGASTAEVLSFAAHIRDGVEDRFGVRLGPECDLVGCALPE